MENPTIDLQENAQFIIDRLMIWPKPTVIEFLKYVSSLVEYKGT